LAIRRRRGPGDALAPSPLIGQVAPHPRAGPATVPRQPRLADAHAPRKRALPALHAWQLANWRAQVRRPNTLHAPRTSSSLALTRAQLRAAPPCPPSPPVGARQCAPLSTAPAQVQASQ
jgi:hypothetical protein